MVEVEPDADARPRERRLRVRRRRVAGARPDDHRVEHRAAGPVRHRRWAVEAAGRQPRGRAELRRAVGRRPGHSCGRRSRSPTRRGTGWCADATRRASSIEVDGVVDREDGGPARWTASGRCASAARGSATRTTSSTGGSTTSSCGSLRRPESVRRDATTQSEASSSAKVCSVLPRSSHEPSVASYAGVEVGHRDDVVLPRVGAASRSHSAARPGLSGSSRQPYSPMAIGVSPSHSSRLVGLAAEAAPRLAVASATRGCRCRGRSPTPRARSTPRGRCRRATGSNVQCWRTGTTVTCGARSAASSMARRCMATKSTGSIPGAPASFSGSWCSVKMTGASGLAQGRSMLDSQSSTSPVGDGSPGRRGP